MAIVAGVIGALIVVPGRPPERPMMNAVPVSIVSDVVIEAAAPDNPSEELVTEDATTAPVAAPPEPAPPEPAPPPPPTPTPAPAKKAPTPRPPTPRPPQPQPQPPRAQPTPPRKTNPTPPRTPSQPQRPREDSLDLDALSGPPRQATRPGTRPATGQQGRGSAPQATGPQVAAIFNQVYDNWSPPCQTPGARNLRVQMDVTLDDRGRITAGPTLVGARSDPVWRAVADGAMQALVRTAPFDVPAGFEGGTWRPTFLTERMCGNR